MQFSTLLYVATSLLATASAHGGIGKYTIGTDVYQGWQPYQSASGQKSIQRQYGSFDPLMIPDLQKVNIRCNNAGALGTGLSASVAAGSTIKSTWTQWTHRPAAIMVYMAKCPSSGCNGWDGAGTVWFKIAHAGLISGTQQAGIWIGDQIVDTLSWDVKIPATLAPGEYLIRHDLLALHQKDNPQFYPECAQLIVTGSGTSVPPSSLLLAFPGAYKATDPGIAFNIDGDAAKTATSYPIPGGPVWDGTGNAPAPEPQPEPVPTTLATVPAPPKPTTPSCSPVARYGQCGGKTYSGCTGAVLDLVVLDPSGTGGRNNNKKKAVAKKNKKKNKKEAAKETDEEDWDTWERYLARLERGERVA
ncbi:carbohydrate-binding module family 1 protein [Aaosphaeria arxii CBS 175.79]|uniref:AA9 family lytic polysaccharide monooxygenase n=1 Tax=Aaosphaeria arxii CBS 175.79 TaxID=1450172 RepID=A0A6A5Y366_9PLEO|nr:carbohydrate-binding module family 1 protein [Aaosphaeria arxii CBS 175.79]KAF2019250.1 carbohydrate-binding module family 1 protein [Aaosphaeria arxii CBS 175.79]